MSHVIFAFMTFTLLKGLVWLQSVWCGTDDYMAKIAPDYHLRQALLEGSTPLLHSTHRMNTMDCTPSRFVIPIVFHIIHSGGQDSIPFERVWNQVLQVFKDYRRIPETSSFSSEGADTEIEFSLATKDPNGNPTTGVIYWRYDQPPLNWSSPDFCRMTQDWSMKEATGWDRTRYLNIWVVPRICVSDDNGNCTRCNTIAGYAVFPFVPSNEAISYGVVMGSEFFWGGNNSRSLRTLTHELGHNLNLFHPFQGGCGTPNCQASGDQVCDTPPTAVTSGNYSVNRQNTCNNDVPDRPDNLRNYMEYVDGNEMNHFTPGQRSRAYNTLTSGNSLAFPLTRPDRLALTGTGPYGYVKAFFTASQRTGCVGQPIQFFSYSMGMPHIHEWDFGGGTADDPGSSCPTVVFPAPGIYDIQLIVENQSGRRDTLRKSQYITILDTIYPLPYVEGFEDSRFPPAHSTIENLDTRRTWERMRGSSPPRGAYGNSPTSMRLLLFQYSSYGERDSWISPPIDLRPYTDSLPHIQLKFSWAYACLNFEGRVDNYASYELDYVDGLKVYASRDCGYTWDLLWEKEGRELATHPDECIVARGSTGGSQFIPTASTWKTDSLLLDQYKGSILRLRFEGISGWGNNLFVDDIQVDTTRLQVPASLPHSSPHLKAYIAEGKVHIAADSPLRYAKLTLYDAHGREAWSSFVPYISTSTVVLPLPETLAPGAYLLRIQHRQGAHTLRYLHTP